MLRESAGIQVSSDLSNFIRTDYLNNIVLEHGPQRNTQITEVIKEIPI